MTSVLICVAALWLTQRLLAVHQSMRFRRQLLNLRSEGRISVGLGKRYGRAVYVGLAFDNGGRVTAALVLRGVTVFATGKPVPELIGYTAKGLAAGKTPAGLTPLAVKATVQASEFMAASLRRSAANTTVAA